MSSESLKEIAGVARVAIKEITGNDPPDPLEITFSRGPWWCGVEDDEVENEDHGKGVSFVQQP